MQGNVHPHARPAFDRGEVSGSLPMRGMTLVFQLTSAQQSGLDMLLRRQLDPSSAEFHQWLTPECYADRFGLAPADLARIAQWLRQQGFTGIAPARSRTFIRFTGTAAQVRLAFHTAIHNYAVGGEVHYANVTEPALPAAFRGVVAAIGGLNDFRPKPRAAARTVSPHFTSDLSGNHYLAPDDFATIYDVHGLYS
ncbi:MAG: protease pro-enzyme activation domain-containing protein, partial [Candidatus Korobacteraceae bacterium]